MAEDAGYDAGLARCLRNIAYYHVITSDLREALKLVNQALDQLRDVGDKQGEATALDIKAVTYWRLGSFDLALEHSFECLELSAKVGDRRGEGWAKHNLGAIYLEVGDLEQAIRWFNAGGEVFAEIDYTPGRLRALSGLGEVYFEKGDFSTALEHHQACLDGSAAVDLPLFTVGASREIGRCYRELGQPDRAMEYFNRSVDAFELVDHRETKADTLTDLALLCAELGDHKAGLEHLALAGKLLEGTGARPTQLRVEQGFSQLYEETGDHAAALDHHKRYHDLKEEVYSDDSNTRLKNLQISVETEKAEREAEIHRLRYVELAQMQARLIQSEKMAMLGSLVAGLAHEVNNPIGIINSNTDVSRRAVARLRSDLENSEVNAASSSTLDLLDRNQADTAEAGRKISSLIDSLVGFAGLDQAEQQFANINKALEDTINLWRSQVPSEIEVHTDFGELPQVRCNPQELCQVFMTLLVNAVDAIDGPGCVTVATATRDDRVQVRIEDTGRGMEQEQIDQLFDIGFSDKGPTMRMSVGLANGYNVIHRHGGDIRVSSQPGKGTEFAITLPV